METVDIDLMLDNWRKDTQDGWFQLGWGRGCMVDGCGGGQWFGCSGGSEHEAVISLIID